MLNTPMSKLFPNRAAWIVGLGALALAGVASGQAQRPDAIFFARRLLRRAAAFGWMTRFLAALSIFFIASGRAAFAVSALAAGAPCEVDGIEAADVSYPGFVAMLRALGADLEVTP